MSHLQFVDENILMGSPMVKEVTEFKKILDLFNLASGTVINQEKNSGFLFQHFPLYSTTSGHLAWLSNFVPSSQIFRSSPSVQISSRPILGAPSGQNGSQTLKLDSPVSFPTRSCPLDKVGSLDPPFVPFLSSSCPDEVH
jgi:hypothetical protein